MLRLVHLGLGWAISGWLLLMAASGTLLLYKPQLKAFMAPSCAAGSPLPLPKALSAIDRDFPGKVRLVVPASAQLCLHEVTFRAPGGGAYVDPATLRIAQTWGPNGRPTDVLLELHRHLLLQDRGRAPTSVFAIASLLVTMMGLVLALRRSRALSLRLWPLARSPGALLASHRNMGVLVGLPLAFMAASGWALTYPKTAQGLLAGLLGEHRLAPPPPAHLREAGPVRWDAALEAARAAFPGLEPRVVIWPDRGGAVVFRFRQPGEWAVNGQSSAVVAPVGAQLIARIDARRARPSQRVWGALHPLHAGELPQGAGRLLVSTIGVGTGFALVLALWANSLRALRRRTART